MQEKLKQQFYQNLEELTQLRGVSGREDAVREAILSKIKDYCHSWHIDNTGNLIAEVKGKNPAAKKLMLSAHLDEVGFMVTHVEDNGLLRVANVGGIMPAVAAARPVLAGEKSLPGTIGVKPIHLLDEGEKDKYPKIEEMQLDIGVDTKEEASRFVSPGDQVTFVGEYREIGDGCVVAKAIDDRAGCALLIALISSELPCDCTFAFTCQEETGCLGGGTAAFGVRPDIGIAVEGTTAGDTPAAPDHKKVCKLRHGPVISYKDRGTTYDYQLYTQATRIAREKNIAWQTKEGVFGGNESRSVQSAAGGAKVLAVSVPVRYIHSAHSMAAKCDFESTYDLLLALVEVFGA